MAPKKPQEKTPEELFLQPLARLAGEDPEIEALVFWGDADGWPALPSEALESEEITFWAEGLIPESFHLEWRVIAGPDGTSPDHIRLYAWETGEAPPEGDAPVLARASWPA